MRNDKFDRRGILKRAGIAGVSAVAGAVLLSRSGQAVGALATPRQAEGPFYPVQDQLDKDADMTRVTGRVGEALGEKFRLQGALVDAETGVPIDGALVEFWQACASGRYNHPRDSNRAPLDPNFQYWSQVRTDAQGHFTVKTIRPGAYPASSTWERPPHIHVKVHKAGYPSLTTQLYFSGDPLNDRDTILQALTPEQRDLVITNLESATDGSEVAHATWTIYLSKFVGLDQSPLGINRVTPEIE